MLNNQFSVRKTVLVFTILFSFISTQAQNVSQRLQKAWQQFESDSQLKHAISSLYVIDAKTGQVVFDKNSQIGLAPASTQKIITAATAFELLGKDYRYKTEFWWTKFKNLKSGQELISIKPSGDPTFGSGRFAETNSKLIIDNYSKAIKQNNIKPEDVFIDYLNKDFDHQKIPDGWIWQDIGNYYGAGAGAFNWKENMSDITLSASAIVGDNVTVKSTDTLAGIGKINNLLLAGAKGSGDNAYYYFHYGNHYLSYPLLKGTIPVGEKNFKISVSVADPFNFFLNELSKNNLIHPGYSAIGRPDGSSSWPLKTEDKLLFTHYSPSLDSISYWFLKKSINLYGEALLKTFAFEKNGFGSTDGGVKIVKDFWKQKGIDDDELNISDGSGLSPQNRVTTHAQVEILKYAKSKDWFSYYLNGFPDYNGMKMKSGTIRDVKGFSGYHKAKDGKEYIFSFLVNNYNGRTSGVVSKMYKVLDELK